MRIVRLLPLFLLLLAVMASPAGASIEIGQLGAPFEAGQCAGVANVQVKVETGTVPYAVPAGGGVITAWKTRTGQYAGSNKLKVFRATGNPNEYLVVGEDGPKQLKKNESLEFPGIHIPVQAGDMLGLIGLGTNCTSYHAGQGGYLVSGFETGVDPAVGTAATIKSSGTQVAMEVAAIVEPDADLDGYGDETEDSCPADASAQAFPCPVKLGPAPPPPAPDVKAPQLALSSKAKQEALKVKAVIAVASADEAVTFTASGSVNVPRAGAFSLSPSTVPGVANTKTSIRLGLSKSVRKKIAAALKKGRKVKASIHVVAKDAAGNASNATQAVTIKKSASRTQSK